MADKSTPPPDDPLFIQELLANGAGDIHINGPNVVMTFTINRIVGYKDRQPVVRETVVSRIAIPIEGAKALLDRLGKNLSVFAKTVAPAAGRA